MTAHLSVLLEGVGLLLWLWSKPQPDPKEYRGDYGNLFKAPSHEAEAILTLMTLQERLNLKELLDLLQQSLESAVEKGPLSFHPDARAAHWGTALAKIGDHYYNTGRTERALFFARAAWHLSKYPVFAFNAGILSIEMGDVADGRSLLEAYLDGYPEVLTSPALRLVNPEVTTDELESLAERAKARLAAL